MEFLINFKTIMEAHLVPSWSRTQVWKHQVPIPIPDTATATKNLAIYTKKKKIGNKETGSGTAFPRLHFRDRSPEIMGIRTAFTGPHFRDHGNQDFILNITEAG